MSSDDGNDRDATGAPVTKIRDVAAKVDNPPGGAALFMRAARVTDEYLAASARDGRDDQLLLALATTLAFVMTLAARPDLYDDGQLLSDYRRALAKVLLERVAADEEPGPPGAVS